MCNTFAIFHTFHGCRCTPLVDYITAVFAGNYKGKLLSKKEYRKLESSGKESGYAWRAVNQDGETVYVDGARHRGSNWLRYLNCARGQCEENVLVRNIPGEK